MKEIKDKTHDSGTDEHKSGPSSSIKWVEQMIAVINKYGIVKILQALVAIIIISLLVYIVSDPNKMFKLYDTYRDEEHKQLIEQRIENTPKIQNACDELLFRSLGSRVIFMELHNNTGNISGMPFYYASASCESLDDGVLPVASQYLDIKLSLMPFASHLFKSGFWEGNIEEMKQYDKSLYYKMMSNNVGYAMFILVEGIDRPCGIIILTYEHATPHKDKEEEWRRRTIKELERASRKISYYVEAPKMK